MGKLTVVKHLLSSTGTHPDTLLHLLRTAPAIYREYKKFRQMAGSDADVKLTHVCVRDRRAGAGTVAGHYFHQDLFVARRIYENRPERHVDVGSAIHGFVAHVAVFREIEVFDIRALPDTVHNIRFKQMDLQKIRPEYREYCDSLSCLHALEHFGLGRYGDELDVHGHVKGFASLASMLKPGGRIYLSVPIGRERVEFNAHRVFNPATILDLMHPQFDLAGFVYVNDRGDLIENVEPTDTVISKILQEVVYGCGIFEAVKR